MIYKTKTRSIVEVKWERKKYLQECDSETKDRLNKTAYVARNFNCKRYSTDKKSPIHKKLEGTTEHVLECQKANKFTLSEENNNGEHEEITEFYRKNKKKRENAVVQVQD